MFTRLMQSLVILCLAAGAAHAGVTYQLTSKAESWTDAEAEAVSLGGHLLAINDAAENALLVNLFGSERLWIGFTDQAVEGTWVWINGDPVTYTNWWTNQPDNWGGNQHYAIMSWDYPPGTWNDTENTWSARGIMEFRQDSTVPEPSTLVGAGFAALVGLAYTCHRRRA